MTASATSTACAPVGATPSLKDRIRVFLTEAGLTRTESWVRRVARDYVRVAIPGTPINLFIATRVVLSLDERQHVAARPDLRFLLSYADPTGETAARNVDRERRRGGAG